MEKNRLVCYLREKYLLCAVIWREKKICKWVKSFTKKACTLLIIRINVLYNEGKSDIVLKQLRCIGQLTAMRLDYVPDIHCKKSFFGKIVKITFFHRELIEESSSFL